MSMGVMEMDGRVFTPEDQLFPPLSINDRHPSAPLLHSMLSSGIVNQPINTTKELTNIISPEGECANQRSRSWSMPINAIRPPLPPQISISSPDEIQDYFCKFLTDTLTMLCIHAILMRLNGTVYEPTHL